MMKRLDMPELNADLAELVRQAMATNRVVNVPVVAEQLRRKHEHLNIALEDLEELVLQSASQLPYPIEFDTNGDDAKL
ncbi:MULTISPECIES: hypothetical protein [unclassified Aminobacter]|jgi:hypothetical protein|uniref:hypothetical protein n=1 Tax=unclassified Aminobacter TaxID=2644704 RepID=UPI00046359E5|nr:MULTISPECIES: hypothetical protein [unclassified Aminobacter]TWG64105.1 hypothetical protein L610_001700000680 [Aminobacter sp. J44]TWH34712.1 hypothetical protein L611_001500000260 [Aminobacter sp. J15]